VSEGSVHTERTGGTCVPDDQVTDERGVGVPAPRRAWGDRAFLGALCVTALPVAVQSLLSSSRSVIDVLLVSRLGDEQVAAVGYGSRVVFVVMLATMGMADGGAVITAQLWGARSPERVRRATAVTTAVAVGISLVAAVACQVWAHPLASLATDDPRVVDLGAQYVRSVIWMIVPYAVLCSFAASLRCVGHARIAMSCTTMGLVLHLVLAWALVLGNAGMPRCGVRGAGYATTLSTYLECFLLVAYLYGKRHAVAFGPADLLRGVRDGLVRRIREVGVPVAMSSTSWALGILVYNILVGHAGTTELAVLSMISPVESAAIAVFIGVSTASGVMLGNSMGATGADRASGTERTWSLARALLFWAGATTLAVCLCLLSSFWWIGALYGDVAPGTLEVARDTTLVLAVVFAFRAMNITMMNGMLRAGGDTTFVLGADLVSQWAVAVPLTYLTALVLELPFPLVFLAVNAEEIVKFWISGRRLLRRRWIRNLVADPAPDTPHPLEVP